MQRKKPSPLPAAPPISSLWHFDPDAGVLRWHASEKPATLRGCAIVALGAAGFTLACVLPVCLLSELLIIAVEALRGRPYAAFSYWNELYFWTPILGTAALVWLITFCLMLGKQVRVCEFNAHSRTLSYTESGPGRRTRSHLVPFDGIVSMRPRLMSGNATSGAFEIHLREAGGAAAQKDIGRDTPLTELRLYAQWLKGMLAERVEPTLQLDT